MNSFKVNFFYTIVIILTQISLQTSIVTVLHSKNITFKDVNICFYTTNAIRNSFQENPEKYCKNVGELGGLKNILPKAVHTISIRNQNISVVYKNSFHRVNNSKVLILQNSEVRVIEVDAFLEANGFYKFDFQWNKIEEISAGVFNNLNLKYLNLNHNKIKHIAPEALDNLKYLLEINLSDNELSIYDKKWFRNTPVLQELHFENNSIINVPANAFRSFRDHLRFSVYLSFNKIKQVDPKAFRDLQHTVIRKFYIDNNQLESWQEQLSSNIIEIKIDHNKIKCFEGNLQQILKNSSVTHFEFNPYNCTSLKEIKTWSDANSEESEWFKSNYMKCREDAKMNGNRKRSGTLLHNLKVFSST